MKRAPSFRDPEVAALFATYPPRIRRKLLALRALIFRTAAETPGVGTLTEALRWGESAYITDDTRSGSTIRIAWKARTPQQYGLYFLCQTSLVESFRNNFPKSFRFEGNRAIVFDELERVPMRDVRSCIAAALTYNLKASRARSTVARASGGRRATC